MSKMNSHIGAFSFAPALIAAVFVLLFALVCTPGQAEAKSYAIPKVDIRAQLESDGSLHVVEQREFSFDGDYSRMKWSFSQLPSNASVKVNSVRLVKLDESGNPTGDVSALPSISFDLKWRDDESAGPGSGSYSLDDPKNSVYVFFPEKPSNTVVELDYTIANMAQAYDDVSEIYWQYLSSWEVTSQNVSVTLELPVPNGTVVTAGENVRAWGHGPAGGDVEINSDGSITAKVDAVKSGEYAELRVLVPTTWLTNLSAKVKKIHSGELRAETVIKEEKTWSDNGAKNAISQYGFVIGFSAVCALLLIIALVLYFRFGKEYEPDFKDKYLSEDPASELHPSVVGRLWRWNRETTQDLVAAIMHLAQTGQISITRGFYERAASCAGDGSLPEQAVVNDYSFTRLASEGQGSDDPVDQATLHLLFDVFGEGRDSLWLASLAAYGQSNPQRMLDAVKAWQQVVSDQVESRNLFEATGKNMSKRLFVVAAALAVVVVLLALGGCGVVLLVVGLLAAALLALIANAMPRRTREGNNVVARCKALRNWLRDSGESLAGVSLDDRQRGAFVVYAYQFDATEKLSPCASLEVAGLLKRSIDASLGAAVSAPSAARGESGGDFGGSEGCESDGGSGR